MGTYRFYLGPVCNEEAWDVYNWRGGLVFLWGRYATDPAGTKFHMRVVPTALPTSMVNAGKSPFVLWMGMEWGEGSQVIEMGRGWTSPALKVRDGSEPPEEEVFERFGAGEDAPPWGDGLPANGNGVPEPGDGWDWAIGACLRVCYPLDWVSPTPSLDEFEFKVEVWSSREVQDPANPDGPPLDEAAEFLYTILDKGVAMMDHPCRRATAATGDPIRLCPGMVGRLQTQIEVPQVWEPDVELK